MTNGIGWSVTRWGSPVVTQGGIEDSCRDSIFPGDPMLRLSAPGLSEQYTFGVRDHPVSAVK